MRVTSFLEHPASTESETPVFSTCTERGEWQELQIGLKVGVGTLATWLGGGKNEKQLGSDRMERGSWMRQTEMNDGTQAFGTEQTGGRMFIRQD